MKEPKQSSPALSNPLAPRDQTHPHRSEGQREQPRGQDQGSRSRFPSSGPRGAADSRRAVGGRPSPAGGEGGAGRGCPAAVVKDGPLRELPPPRPLPPAVPGPRQRKTKTRAEETAAGAPPEKPGQKARTSRPRWPAAGVPALPPGLRPLPRQRRESRPPPTLLPPHLPPRPTTSHIPCSRARRARAVRPRLCLPSGWPRPGPSASSPAAPGRPPSPAERLTWGGRGSGRGGIPTRQKATPFIGRQRRLCGRGTVGGEGRDPGGGGARPRSAPFAPDGAHAPPPPGHQRAKGAEAGACAGSRARGRDAAWGREVVSGRQSGPASRGPAQREDDLGPPRKQDKGIEPRTGTGSGRAGGKKGKGSRETQLDRDARNRDRETQ